MPAPEGRPFAPGDVLAGRYRIVGALGEGGMAFVFEAVHLRLKQPVAIKVLRAELAAHPEIVARFEREGRAVGKLRTRHAVRVSDVDETAEGVPFLVMERLEGRTLEAEIRARGPLPIDEATHYLAQACVAVAEAHDCGIIHRDLKPANLFLVDEGNERIVKVLDFGISADLLEGDARLTRTEAVMGTPVYMAPEQLRSSKDVDARADVWALGATLYEMLAGRPPFAGTMTSVAISIVNDPLPPIEEHRRDLPPALVGVIRRALAKDREQRFASVRQLAAALGPSVRSIPAPAASQARAAGPPAAIEPTQLALGDQRDTSPAATATAPRLARHRSLLAVAAALVVAAIAAVVVFSARGTHPAPPTGASPTPVSAATTEPPRPAVDSASVAAQVTAPTAPTAPIASASAEPTKSPPTASTLAAHPPSGKPRPTPSSTEAPSAKTTAAAPKPADTSTSPPLFYPDPK